MLLTAVILTALSAAPNGDVQPDGTVYRKFDYALMAKIKADNAAKREAGRRYDPVTWLPVEEEKPRPHKSAHLTQVQEERRAARLRMVALRKQRHYPGAAMVPSIPTIPRCPWAWLNYMR